MYGAASSLAHVMAVVAHGMPLDRLLVVAGTINALGNWMAYTRVLGPFPRRVRQRMQAGKRGLCGPRRAAVAVPAKFPRQGGRVAKFAQISRLTS